MRTPIIAGNWKMNHTPDSTRALIEALKPLVADAACQVVVCPPFVCLPAAVEAARGSNIRVGAQNIHWAEKGAFTGEISAAMLEEIGVEFVITGHSERRQYFGETDQTVNARTRAAIAAGFTPIICVGETLAQREEGVTEQVVRTQTVAAFEGISEADAAGCIIAYEPVWAIGTGKTATKEQANEVIAYIRGVIGEIYSPATAEQIRIQYGGSMNKKNANELMSMPDIDGGLIGGASLVAEDFAALIDEATRG